MIGILPRRLAAFRRVPPRGGWPRTAVGTPRASLARVGYCTAKLSMVVCCKPPLVVPVTVTL